MRISTPEALGITALAIAALGLYKKSTAHKKNKHTSTVATHNDLPFFHSVQPTIELTDELHHAIFTARDFREIKKIWVSLREKYLTCEHSKFPENFFESVIKKLLRCNLSWRFYNINAAEKDATVLMILEQLLEYDFRNKLLSAEEKTAIKNSTYLVSSSLLVSLSFSNKISPEIVSNIVNYFLTFPAANDKKLLSEEIARQLLKDTGELDSDTINLTAHQIIHDHIVSIGKRPAYI